jgi:hypothetical protein
LEKLQAQVPAHGLVDLEHDRVRATPSRSPLRSTAIERTCSAWAFESRSSPVWAAGSSTWNG